MQCSQCGKTNSVEINQKRYCANCGTPASENHQSDNKSSKVALLDLSTKKSAKKTVPHEFSPVRKPKSAQSIHGISRSQPKNPASTQRAHQRSAHAATVAKSPAIARFSKSSPVNTQANKSTTDMAPHRSYAVSPTPKQKQVSDNIASHSSSYIRHGSEATSQQPKNKQKRKSVFTKIAGVYKKRPRLATTMAVVASVVVLGAYVTYLNFPNIALRVAASRAGIDAQVPRYTPAGYDFAGPVRYGPGQITVTFNSNSDNSFLELTQQKTDMDSASLKVDRFSNNDIYQENLVNGLTVYLYGNNNATWVNNGILYTIEGSTKLNAEQILKLASSL